MTLLAGFKNIYIHSGNRKEHSLENRNFIKELTIFSKFKGKEAETGPRVPWASWSLPSLPPEPGHTCPCLRGMWAQADEDAPMLEAGVHIRCAEPSCGNS